MPMGLLLPYMALYLGDVAKLSGLQIGVVFGVVPLVGLAAQPAWGYWADRSGRRELVLFLLNLGCAAGYLLLWRADSFLEITAATAFLATFMRALIPIAMSVTLPAFEGQPARFGRVRACGTVGFLAAVLAFPYVISPASTGSEEALSGLFPAAAGAALLAAFAALLLPKRPSSQATAKAGDWRALLHNRVFLRLVAITFLAFLFLNGPMEIFPLLVTRERGGDIGVVSLLWLVMLVPELLGLLFFREADRLGARGLLAIGIAAGGLRWLLSGAIDSLPWLYATQLLHGVVVIGLMLGGPLYIHSVVSERLQSTAQGLHGAVALGLGGAVSSLMAGWLLDVAGTSAPFLVGGAGGLLLALLLPVLLPPEKAVRNSSKEAAPATGLGLHEGGG